MSEPQDDTRKGWGVNKWPRSQAEAEEVWKAAMQAHAAEMTRCLRDRALWRDQAAVVALGLLKAFCLFLAVRVLVLMTGLPDEVGVTLGLLVIPPVVMFHPQVFIRNLFADRADAAFNAEVERRREEAQRGSAGG